MKNDEDLASAPTNDASTRAHAATWIGVGFALACLTGLVLVAGSFVDFVSEENELARVARASARHVEPVDWPDFRLTKEDNHSLSRADLLGEVWIADFFSLECTSCLALSRHIADVQEKLQHRSVRFVSFSIDPAGAPRMLAQHRAKYRRADASRWNLLQADDEQLPRLLVWLGMARNADLARALNCTLLPRFFLVDERGRLRGSYDANTPEQLDWLAHDADALASAREEAAPANPQELQGDPR